MGGQVYFSKVYRADKGKPSVYWIIDTWGAKIRIRVKKGTLVNGSPAKTTFSAWVTKIKPGRGKQDIPKLPEHATVIWGKSNDRRALLRDVEVTEGREHIAKWMIRHDGSVGW
jgi:hypothetical protein